MTNTARRVLRTTATIAALSTLAAGVAAGTASAEPVDAEQRHHLPSNSVPVSDDGDEADSPVGDFFTTRYPGPEDDGFEDESYDTDYDEFDNPDGRDGCADSDDAQDYHDCDVEDFEGGGGRGGDGYDNSNSEEEDDNVPPGQAPGAFFDNEERDEDRQISPPGSVVR